VQDLRPRIAALLGSIVVVAGVVAVSPQPASAATAGARLHGLAKPASRLATTSYETSPRVASRTGASSAGTGAGSATPEVAMTGTAKGPYVPLTPARICDTRPGNPSGLSGEAAQCNGSGNAGEPLIGGSTLDVSVAGVGGVPASGVAGVVMNVTVTGPTSGGYLTVYPDGVSRPTASNLNFTPGETVANLVEVGLGQRGKVSFYSAFGETNVIVDVEGFYTGDPPSTAPQIDALSPSGSVSGDYVALPPQRICDTRPGNPSDLSGQEAQCNGSGNAGDPLKGGAVRSVAVAGVGEVPSSGVTAVVMNVTVTRPTAGGYLDVYPAGSAPPVASEVNFSPGETVANLVEVSLGKGGEVSFYDSAGTANLVVDVEGFVSDPADVGMLSTVVITGSNFGAMQGTGYVRLADNTNGVSWGAPGNVAYFRIESWSNTQIAIQIPSESGWWAGVSWMPEPGDHVTATVYPAGGGASNPVGFTIGDPATHPYGTLGNAAEYSGPGTSYSKVGTLASGAQAPIVCQGTGQIMSDSGSPSGTSDIWDQLSNGSWVTDTMVNTPNANEFSPPIPQCTGWTANPYPPGSNGYDISFPQCSINSSGSYTSSLGSGPPTPYTVDIVGVDSEPGGWNPCLAAEASYNAGNRPALEGYIVPADSTSTTPTGMGVCGGNQQCRYGYATAKQAYDYAVSVLGSSTPATWLLDVEHYTSFAVNPNGAQAWLPCSVNGGCSGSEATANIAALEGNLYFFIYHSLSVGIYASPSEWHQITGGWSTLTGPFDVVGDWVALWMQGSGNTPPANCSPSTFSGYVPFSNGPFWMLQWGPTGGSSGDSWDGDMSCYDS